MGMVQPACALHTRVSNEDGLRRAGFVKRTVPEYLTFGQNGGIFDTPKEEVRLCARHADAVSRNRRSRSMGSDTYLLLN